MRNELLGFAHLAAAVARRVAPIPSRFAHSAYAPAALFAALLLRGRLRLTYRGLEDLLRLSAQLRRVLGLHVVPDHSTFWHYARRHVSPELLKAGLSETALRGKSDEERATQLALDSTGLFLTHTSRSFEWRAKRDRGQRGWLKWVGRAAAPACPAGSTRTVWRLFGLAAPGQCSCGANAVRPALGRRWIR